MADQSEASEAKEAKRDESNDPVLKVKFVSLTGPIPPLNKAVNINKPVGYGSAPTKTDPGILGPDLAFTLGFILACLGFWLNSMGWVSARLLAGYLFLFSFTALVRLVSILSSKESTRNKLVKGALTFLILLLATQTAIVNTILAKYGLGINIGGYLNFLSTSMGPTNFGVIAPAFTLIIVLLAGSCIYDVATSQEKSWPKRLSAIFAIGLVFTLPFGLFKISLLGIPAISAAWAFFAAALCAFGLLAVKSYSYFREYHTATATSLPETAPETAPLLGATGVTNQSARDFNQMSIADIAEEMKAHSTETWIQILQSKDPKDQASKTRLMDFLRSGWGVGDVEDVNILADASASAEDKKVALENCQGALQNFEVVAASSLAPARMGYGVGSVVLRQEKKRDDSVPVAAAELAKALQAEEAKATQEQERKRKEAEEKAKEQQVYVPLPMSEAERFAAEVQVAEAKVARLKAELKEHTEREIMSKFPDSSSWKQTLKDEADLMDYNKEGSPLTYALKDLGVDPTVISVFIYSDGTKPYQFFGQFFSVNNREILRHADEEREKARLAEEAKHTSSSAASTASASAPPAQLSSELLTSQVSVAEEEGRKLGMGSKS